MVIGNAGDLSSFATAANLQASAAARPFDVGTDAMTGVLARSTIIDLLAKEDRMMLNIDSIIRDHVTLTVRCLDRIYLQGYMPKLQTSDGLCYFLHDHLGQPIPSPALFRPMHDRFIAAIKTFAADHAVSLIEFKSGQDKDAIVASHRARFRGEDGVVVIGVAQEKARAFKAHKRTGPHGGVTFDFTRQSVGVNHYYFYVQDPEWLPAFLKIGTYVPYPIKLCLNGHEWVKQQLRRAHIAFTWVNRHQQAVIEYLLEENRVLRAVNGSRRLPLTDDPATPSRRERPRPWPSSSRGRRRHRDT